MRLLVVGSNGQLGTDMVRVLWGAGHEVGGVDLPDIDITDRDSTNMAMGTRPAVDVIVNCAAYTDVDACEENRDAAFAVNAGGVECLALAARAIDASMVHISTDYVFDGTGKVPYTESDRTNPQTVYGESKLEGEERLSRVLEKHYILRPAWLYGMHGNNFVKTMRKLSVRKVRDGQSLPVVSDQFGTPTYTIDVCKQVAALLPTGEYGLYHCTNQGECSWYDFARHIAMSDGTDVKVVPCSTEEFPRPAPRPHYSVLENSRLQTLGIDVMRHWKEAYDAFLEESAEMQP